MVTSIPARYEPCIEQLPLALALLRSFRRNFRGELASLRSA